MSREHRIVIWAGMAAVGAVLVLFLILSRREQPVTLTGVVIRQDTDPRKQVPVTDVEITAANGLALHGSKSDSSGLFHLSLHPGLRRDQPILLKFRHPEYIPLDLSQPVGKNMLYVFRMSPIPRAAIAAPRGPKAVIAQVSIRYSVKTSTAVDIGSAMKTFEVANTGNVECRGQKPCSPDGRWKATAGAMSLDAGEGNAFRNPRVSCIAGPCPFTKIDSNGLAEGGRVFNVSVRDWSDPATFLVEAEVVHPMTGEIIRQSYPAILGRDMNFTLPAEAEGASIEAEVDGSLIVFPLGPELCLSWAECNVKIEKDHTSTYRCELKPGVEFR
jgi:hypothetical protein